MSRVKKPKVKQLKSIRTAAAPTSVVESANPAPLPRFPGDAEPRTLVGVVEADIQPGNRKIVVQAYDDSGCRITSWIGADRTCDVSLSAEATEALRRALNLAAL